MEVTQYIILFFIEIIVLAVLLNFIMNHAEKGETITKSWNYDLDYIRSYTGNEWLRYNHTEIYGFELDEIKQSISSSDDDVVCNYTDAVARNKKYLLTVIYDTNEHRYVLSAKEVGD